ncbi:hypothetical protein P0136_03185 [Lentisphaerota bacterium ZTH]|nr:hypothetical protein JYG24_05680 [Lentisphaerota bacterium]WET07006.1 hypothetical protein P0136_03185 [Lentisphaerota bacterium ZTH]
MALKYLPLNQDPDLIINYDFENSGYRTSYKGLFVPSLCNIAGAPVKDSEYRDFDGVLVNSPRLLKQGRWPGKGAIRFDGIRTFAVVPGCTTLNPSENGISIITWIRFNHVDKVQCIYGCARGLIDSKFNLFWRKKSFRSSWGGHEFSTPSLKIHPARWYHLVLTADSGGQVSFFLNGKQLPFNGRNDRARLIKDQYELIIGGLCLNNTADGINTHTVFGEQRRCRIAAAFGLRDMFDGEIDEFLIFKRPLSQEFIKRHYKTGRPH